MLTWESFTLAVHSTSLRELLAIRWLRWTTWAIVAASLALPTWIVVSRFRGPPSSYGLPLPFEVVVLFVVVAFSAFLLWSCLLAVVAILRALGQLVRISRAVSRRDRSE